MRVIELLGHAEYSRAPPNDFSVNDRPHI